MTTQDTPSGQAAIKLAETLDLCAAAPLAGALLSLRGHDVEIDASEVRRLGGQCLQVLLAAGKTWAADGHALTFTNPSAEFVDGMALLGAPVPGLVSTH
jgi:chemotaxis protein CheX